MKTLIKVLFITIIIALIPLLVSLFLSQIEINPDKIIAISEIEKKGASVQQEKNKLSNIQIVLLVFATLILSLAYFYFIKKYVFRKNREDDKNE